MHSEDKQFLVLEVDAADGDYVEVKARKGNVCYTLTADLYTARQPLPQRFSISTISLDAPDWFLTREALRVSKMPSSWLQSPLEVYLMLDIAKSDLDEFREYQKKKLKETTYHLRREDGKCYNKVLLDEEIENAKGNSEESNEREGSITKEDSEGGESS